MDSPIKRFISTFMNKNNSAEKSLIVAFRRNKKSRQVWIESISREGRPDSYHLSVNRPGTPYDVHSPVSTQSYERDRTHLRRLFNRSHRVSLAEISPVSLCSYAKPYMWRTPRRDHRLLSQALHVDCAELDPQGRLRDIAATST